MPEEMDGFENRIEFVLPPSYRDFLHLFGAGELAGWFDIDDLKCLEKRITTWPKASRDFDFAEPERMSRLVFFSETHDEKERYAWDPQDHTPRKPGEFRVHLWRKG